MVIWIILQRYIIFNIYANVLSIFCTHYRRNCKKTSITVTHNVLCLCVLAVTLVLGCRQRGIKTYPYDSWFIVLFFSEYISKGIYLYWDMQRKDIHFLDDTSYVLVHPIAVLDYPISVLACSIAVLAVLFLCDGCRRYLRRLSNICSTAVARR